MKDEFEWLCYSYELPWIEYQVGTLKGKSKNNKSRVKLGNYELLPRKDGPKGWRLELQGTGHRTNIQIHRAHRSLFIQGCILPVHFNRDSNIKKNNQLIQTKSIELMNKIKKRFEDLETENQGNALLCISAMLPAKVTIREGWTYV